ncbi:MAG: SnoaL-like domain-containing protein, partial [Nocardia sp.]|nr:SnoaL-like domain-containing protein [Nocardia sp.]
RVPHARLELRRVVADDEHVVVHYRMTTPADERGTAVVDIWRLVDDRIVEHWDVVQPVPDSAQIPNGMV